LISLKQVNGRKKPVTVKAIGVKSGGWVVGGHYEANPSIHKRLKQPLKDHGIGDVRDMKLVKTDQSIASRYTQGHLG
jgi:hypothetical protein